MTDYQLLDFGTMIRNDMKLITGYFGPAWDDRIGAIRPSVGWATGYTGECAISGDDSQLPGKTVDFEFLAGASASDHGIKSLGLSVPLLMIMFKTVFG